MFVYNNMLCLKFLQHPQESGGVNRPLHTWTSTTETIVTALTTTQTYKRLWTENQSTYRVRSTLKIGRNSILKMRSNFLNAKQNQKIPYILKNENISFTYGSCPIKIRLTPNKIRLTSWPIKSVRS